MLRFSRKAVLLVLAVALIAFSFSALPSFAASAITSAEFVIGMNQYFVNNQVPGVSMDAAAYIDSASGRTLAPVRYLADALGATTNWDANTQTVTVSTSVYNISMTIGSATLTVNGQGQTMDVAPVIKDGRTYLPARWVANALGYQVDWNAQYQIVIIWPDNSIGEPSYNVVIQQAQQNAAKPEQVQKLEQALGITMVEDTGGTGDWGYNPEQNIDGSPNTTFDNQIGDDSFVTANYVPGDSNTANSVQVDIQCIGMTDTSVANWDIGPLQTVLEAFFPGQDAAIQQVMTDARGDVANAKKYHGGNPQPAVVLTINGASVGIRQGGRLDFAVLTILGS